MQIIVALHEQENMIYSHHHHQEYMATVAQLAEHLTVDHEVAGSSPVGRPRLVSDMYKHIAFFILD